MIGIRTVSKIFFVLFLFLGSVIFGPDLLINRYSLGWLLPHFQKSGIFWESINVNIRYQSLTSRVFSVDFRDLILQSEGHAANFRSAHIVFKSDLNKPFGVSLLRVDADVNSIRLAPKIQSEEPDNSSDIQFLIPESVKKISEIFSNCEWNIRIRELEAEGKKVQAKLSGNSEKNPDISFEVKAPDLMEISGSLILNQENHRSGQVSFYAVNQRLGGLLKFNWNDSELNSIVELNQNRNRITGDLNFNFNNKNEGQGQLNLNLKSPEIPVSEAFAHIVIESKVNDYGLVVNLKSDVSSKITLLTSTKEFVDLTPKGLDLSGETHVLIESRGGKISGSIKSSIKILEKNTEGIYLGGNIDHEFSFGDKSEQNAHVDLKASLKDIKKIESALRQTNLEVPAPFNQLGGSLSCRLINGALDLKTNLNQLKLNCQTLLKSEEQEYKVNANIAISNFLDSQKKPHVSGVVAIREAKLKLPHMSLTDPFPLLDNDPRIITRSEAKFGTHTKKLPFTYRLKIISEGQPVMIATDFFDNPVPIEIAFTLSNDQGFKGSVKVNNHPLTLFRREALVKQIRVLLKPESKDPDIEGDILFENNNYQISMKIFGSVREPKYTFESRPYLDHDDIMSMLLFGKKNSELAQVDMKSAKSAQHAVADKAINLLSMYYLASTPIERIDYNPDDGVFSARLNLTKGTSINLGKNTKDKKVAKIQQVLGENWIFETSYSQEGQKKKSTNGVIKWIKRY